MLDANDLLNAIKKAANDANDAGQPADFCFGKVTNTAPLQILVEQKMTLGAAQLVLTRNVTDFSTLVTVEWETEKELDDFEPLEVKEKDSGNDEVAFELQGEDLAHSHKITGSKFITIHNALQIGDEVVLLKRKGGQKYLVLDRVVTA